VQWIKAANDKRTAGERWVCLVPPEGRLRLEVLARADGRWSWQIFAKDAANPMAAGVARNFGAAKTVTEQFATRNP
jgi:hypothetical protein